MNSSFSRSLPKKKSLRSREHRLASSDTVALRSSLTVCMSAVHEERRVPPNTAIEGTVRGDFILHLGVLIGSSAVRGLLAIDKPVHCRGSLDEADELVGFFESPEIEVDGGASGAVGKGTVVDVEGKGI